MSYEHLLVTTEGSITTITLNRPDKRNALALPVIGELHRAFLAVGNTDARGVILAANGPVFCAGHLFGDMVAVTLEQARSLFDTCRAMMDAMQAMPQPVIAKVHALATAGGCQLVASCDLAVASERASFAIPGGKAGQFCHTPLVAVARNMGRKRALEMAMPQPVIAKVHALATAGGCQLVASCDLAVASERASFAIPGGKAGQFCHTPLVAVARNMGRKRALEMAMTGDPISAQTAEAWGLINRCVPHDDLDTATLDLIHRASRGGMLSKAVGKAAFYRQIDMPQGQSYDFASAVMAEATITPDAQEGFASFLEKRHPTFTQKPVRTAV